MRGSLLGLIPDRAHPHPRCDGRRAPVLGRALSLWPVGLIALIGGGCHAPSSSSAEERQSPQTEYFVSAENRSYLVSFADPATPRDPALHFAALRQESDRFCEMVWGQKRFDRAQSTGLLSPAAFETGPFKKMDHPLPKLIAGCWNFFQMNDTRPDQDFRLLGTLYPTQKKECFSVGLIQPYLMESILDCERLTMIDIDWRILDAHRQIIGLLEKGELKTEAQARLALQGLQLGWSARFDGRPMQARSPASIENLCFASDRKMCLDALLSVQNSFSRLKHIRLEISALHDGDYSVTPGSLAVIFLSNAIEDLYTNREQFDRMIHRVEQSLRPGQSAVFVHHAAGRAQFGLYELTRKEAGSELRTVCRDAYLSSPVGTVYPYLTHFEKITATKQPRSCSGWTPSLAGQAPVPSNP